MRKYAPIAVMLSLAALTGVSYAASAGTAAKISACSNAATGGVRSIALHAHCRRGERTLSWNQQGQRGAPGIQGGVGQPGATGPSGAAGTAGAVGATGPAGPLLNVLPSGRTETGVYEVDASTASTGLASASISFPLALATAPTENFMGLSASPTAQCPGSASVPTAAAGNLCIYEGSRLNVAFFTVFDPRTGSPGLASPFGAGVVITSSGAGTFFSDGTWAVTAS